jgi:hypothetical protein
LQHTLQHSAMLDVLFCLALRSQRLENFLSPIYIC